MPATPTAWSHRMRSRHDKRDQPDLWSASSTEGMVATAHYLATEIGAAALAGGGNAVDAAVAASLAIGVCEPAASGLGGMAMMLIYDAASDRTVLLEGPCRAPALATPEALGRVRRHRGYRAVAVPAYLAVIQRALATYGSWSPAAVLAPAIRLAEEGVPVTDTLQRTIAESLGALRRRAAGPIFLDDAVSVPAIGASIRQPSLAATLGRLSVDGLDDFYQGAIARAMVDDIRAHGGYIERDDLARGPLCRETTPLDLRVDGDVIRTVGPPGGGIALLQMLQVAAYLPQRVDPGTPDGAVVTAAIVRRARRDRQRYRLRVGADHPGDATELLVPRYAEQAASEIRAELAAAPPRPPAMAAAGDVTAAGETTHISVMDRAGNVVSLTQSIERSFGAAVVTPALGFLYNGYLRAFKVVNQRHPHYLQPGAPARSNAAPTIISRHGRPWVAIGSTGSERMASSIFQVLLRLHDQTPFEAVQAPRLHATPGGQVLLEAERFPRAHRAALARRGLTLDALDAYSLKMGGLNLVLRDGPRFVGVGEPRRDGAAAGPDTA